ncbi:MAG: isopenicillin N synthase-like dioxygenase [Alteromonadaceae bacterium]|jgi:isopenicillin N synthase-like dioxygenase
MPLTQIPTLNITDFGKDKTAFVEKIGEAYKQFGFCGISGHGLSDDLMQQAFDVTQAFFALPTAVKQQYFIEGQGGARGYTATGVEKAKGSEYVDLKEFWHVGRELLTQAPHECLYPNVWPKEVEAFKQVALAFYSTLAHIGDQVLRALALVLGQDEGYFVDKTDHGNSVLRLIHYPPIQDSSTQSIRAGEHEDINLITLLVGSHEAGLEVKTREGKWLPVTMLPGAIVVNIGDMLQRLTNNILPSTPHRVVNPDGQASETPRYSMPYFLHPNPEFLIKTLDTCISEANPDQYPQSINSNDFLNERLAEIGLKS